jgi:endoglucanase
LDEAMLARLDAILNAILERGMTAILDFHCLLSEDVYAFTNQREKRDNEERFLAVWAILADRYRDWPAELYFELANEPRRPIMPDDWNRYVSEALALIRASGGGNRTRMVVAANPILVGPVFRSWENGRGIDRLAIPSPEDDPNIIVTVHYYDPVPFTYQGQTYNESLKRYSRFWEGNRWANTERQRTLVRRDFDRIARWAADNRRQVILGEFGVSVFADERSQINWTELVREEAESRGMIWLFWQFFYEYGGDTLGGLWSHAGRFWRVEMVDALQTRERRRNEPPAPPDLSEEEMRAVDQAAAELRAPEWTVREAAARSLAEGEILTDGAASALIAALSADEEWQVRRAAADALYACRPVPAAALPALTEALSHPEWQIRHSAARALGRMGFAAEPALPALRALLADPEWKPREAALLALVFIAPEDGGTRDALRQALSDPEEHIRDTARTLSRHPGLWYRDMVGRRPGRGDTRQ